MSFRTVATTPFTDQKPGTSGLRKRVKVFQQQHYTENFIQASFDAIEALEGGINGSTIVLGGDGRYFSATAVQLVLRIACANGVAKVLVGKDGLLSTPAVSCIIRKRQAKGAFILTASHNPGGPEYDFGMKYNIANGGPAPSSVTDAIYERSKVLTEYKIADLPEIDLSKVQSHTFDSFVVDVIDNADDYVAYMKELFDFPLIKTYLGSGKVSLRIDCLHGVAGPYATRIFVDELGGDSSFVVNNIPKEDFGGGHPDPNLVYAADLVKAMEEGEYDLGVAYDGDADRNMILGKKGFFVTPSDSVAVIAANADCIPYFSSGLKGVARSMPSSGALDRVAEKLKINLYEVPTGWKFFGNLMDDGKLSICGEESFGTGSDHVREKDGVWASLCWLSIMAKKSLSVEEIMKAHWKEFGRNYFTRYDYEEVASEQGAAVMDKLEEYVKDPSLIVGKQFGTYTVASVDNFRYVDPVDKSVTEKQGVRIIFEDGSRIIMRLSGTGSSGATIRMYVDSYEPDTAKQDEPVQEKLQLLVDTAISLSHLKEITGRSEPTVIT